VFFLDVEVAGQFARKRDLVEEDLHERNTHTHNSEQPERYANVTDSAAVGMNEIWPSIRIERFFIFCPQRSDVKVSRPTLS